MKRPPFLKLNDKVAIVSPAGNISPIHVKNTIDILQEWGLEVETAENALSNTGRFSGFEVNILFSWGLWYYTFTR